jgi:hypothetical protein
MLAFLGPQETKDYQVLLVLKVQEVSKASQEFRDFKEIQVHQGKLEQQARRQVSGLIRCSHAVAGYMVQITFPTYIVPSLVKNCYYISKRIN